MQPVWMKELFGVEKPIIAMCHMQPMPGDPAYDADGGMEKVLELARKDLLALQEQLKSKKGYRGQ